MKPFLMNLLIASLLLTAIYSDMYGQTELPYYYELKIYHLKNKLQEKNLDVFLQSAYLPAMHRAGIPTIGIFKPIEPDTSNRRVYVFIPFKSLNEFASTEQSLQQDKTYLENGKEYINASYQTPPYDRMESILLHAFSGMPSPRVPALVSEKSKRVYELRSYESATEKYFVNKVEMFNEGQEIEIFERLGFNAIFYGEVLSGSRMPNLMYMTSFNDRGDREEHWKQFREDPEWIKLSSIPKYQKNVSKADIILLYPADYSDF